MGFEFSFNNVRKTSTHEILRNQFREGVIDRLSIATQQFTTDQLLKEVTVVLYKNDKEVATITTRGQLLVNALKQAKTRTAAISELNGDFDNGVIVGAVAH